MLRIERSEEPQLVLLDRSADISAYVLFGESVRSRTSEREVIHRTHHALASEITKHVSVEAIAAALGDDVENTASGLTVFSAVSTSLDFNFLDEFKRKICAAATECRVGGAYAIKNVVVFRSRRAGDRRITITTRRVTKAGTRHRGSDVVEALHATRGREVQELIGV